MPLVQEQLPVFNVTEMSVDQTFVMIPCKISLLEENRTELCESHLVVKILTVITKIRFSFFQLKTNQNCFLGKSSFDISAEIWSMIQCGQVNGVLQNISLINHLNRSKVLKSLGVYSCQGILLFWTLTYFVSHFSVFACLSFLILFPQTVHKIIDYFRLEGTSEGPLINPLLKPCQTLKDLVAYRLQSLTTFVVKTFNFFI